MGMDPEAILFYGIAFDYEKIGDDEDWYDKVGDYHSQCRDRDCPEPYPEYDKKKDDPKVNPEYAKAWAKWRKAVKEWESSQCEMSFRGLKVVLNPISTWLDLEREWSGTRLRK